MKNYISRVWCTDTYNPIMPIGHAVFLSGAALAHECQRRYCLQQTYYKRLIMIRWLYLTIQRKWCIVYVGYTPYNSSRLEFISNVNCKNSYSIPNMYIVCQMRCVIFIQFLDCPSFRSVPTCKWTFAPAKLNCFHREADRPLIILQILSVLLSYQNSCFPCFQ